ncbi:MAG: SH3 domain-containing protein [bacterium]|nr:SH3 domain-containing protein [bacterium]
MVVLPLLLAACGGGTGNDVASIPTSTLAIPNISRTPRFTATPVITRTPLPTFTPVPSETPIPPTPSETPVPTATPPVIGIVASLQTVNVRSGPSTEFPAILALPAGTGLEILGTNPEGDWYNVRTEDGEEGWIASSLVRVQPTTTPIPTFTPTPDLTALFLGTPLPTAILGGGTITPTPPRSAVTATPPGTPAAEGTESVNATAGPTQPFLPVVRDLTSVYATATALASGGAITTARPSPTSAIALPSTPGGGATSAPGLSTSAVPTVAVTAGAPATSSGSGSVQQGLDVFALCDNPALGAGAPTNVAAGSTIDIYWAWFASTREQVEDHTSAATYDVRINDQQLSNWRQFGQPIRQQGNQYVRYWYVPFGPLTAGQYRITYRVTWSRQIFDGSASFGPGTSTTVEQGSCTFTVR